MKSFLKDSADLKFAPEFQIVDAHGPLLDVDDPLVARFVALQESATKLASQHPSRAKEIEELRLAIAKILDVDPSSDAAYAKIGELEALLKSLQFGDATMKEAGGTKTNEKTTTEKTTPTAPPLDPEAAKFKTRLSEVLKQATPYIATIGGELKKLATKAREFSDKGDPTEANGRLKQMVELIAKAKISGHERRQRPDGKVH